DEANKSGYEIITIPENLRERIRDLKDISGNAIRDLDCFYAEYLESFQFRFVNPDNLTPSEKRVFDMTDEILNLIGRKPKNVKEIKISETMRKEAGTFIETGGIWERLTGRIISKRSQLESIEDYAGTLLQSFPCHKWNGRCHKRI
ncbi:MAG: ATP-binding protein, partial [Candidatus Bathyarchaeia archaeon]